MTIKLWQLYLILLAVSVDFLPPTDLVEGVLRPIFNASWLILSLWLGVKFKIVDSYK